MDLHALYIARLAQELNEHLCGASIDEVFSSDKNTIHFIAQKAEGEFFINFRIEGNKLYLYFPEQIQRIHRGRMDQFKSIWKQPILAIQPHPGERSFTVQFEQTKLVFLCHGRHANILLYEEDQISSFRKTQQKKLPDLMAIGRLEQAAWPSKISDWEEAPFINALLAKNLEQSTSLEAFEDVYQNGPVHLINTGTEYLIDAQIHGELIASYPTLREAITPACELQLAHYFFQRNKQVLSKEIQAGLHQTQKRIKALVKQKKALVEQSNYRHLGDLILSNLPQIHLGDKSVTVQDYLSNQPISILLKEKLSPQDNAQRYYRKAKNQHIEEARIQSELDQLEMKEYELLEQEEQVNQARSMKDMRGLLKEQKKERIPLQRLPYHAFEIMGYQVLVGKQAKDNDELSLKIAKKDDLWLHARDIPGSHVVIRKKSGQAIPEKLIEIAGGLALWFSKRRKESLAPVIYTEKKHIRKRKGAPAGAVVVEKENVLMLAPVSPDYLGNMS